MSKYDLTFSMPIMNAAGFLGFAPSTHGPIDLSRLGAFVTNPISQARRTPARGSRYYDFPGGFLLHTGYPNPGLREVIRRFQDRWAHTPLPIIVHILAEKVAELPGMVRQLETLEGLIAIELGLPKEADRTVIRAFTESALGELPLIVRLPLENAADHAMEAVQSGADAISLAAPRGAYPARAGNLVHGRLYGPALLPLSLAAVKEISKAGLPVIGAGGLYSQAQCDAMLSAGAMAVQLDSLLWRGDW